MLLSKLFKPASCCMTAAALLLLGGCASNSSYNWGWYVFNPFLPKGLSNIEVLISGVGMTLALAVSAILISVVMGLLLAVSLLSPYKALRWLARSYVECFRAIPLLVLLLWVYYGLPVVSGLQFGAFSAGVMSLALSDAAFEAEVFRAGLQSVAKGQREAAETLGLSRWSTLRYVVFPQAIRTILPALGNQFVYVV